MEKQTKSVSKPKVKSKAIAAVKKVKFYDVEVCRIGYGHNTIRVAATSPTDAESKALDRAGNFSFSEKSSDYESDGVSLSSDQVSSEQRGN